MQSDWSRARINHFFIFTVQWPISNDTSHRSITYKKWRSLLNYWIRFEFTSTLSCLNCRQNPKRFIIQSLQRQGKYYLSILWYLLTLMRAIESESESRKLAHQCSVRCIAYVSAVPPGPGGLAAVLATACAAAPGELQTCAVALLHWACFQVCSNLENPKKWIC